MPKDVGVLGWAVAVPVIILLFRPTMDALGKWMPQSLIGRQAPRPKLTPAEKLQEYYQLSKVGVLHRICSKLLSASTPAVEHPCC